MKLKKHHHIQLSLENRADLEMWKYFLHHPSAYCRNFMDFNKTWSVTDILFFTDASRNENLGYGGWFNFYWFAMTWEPRYIQDYKPSIAYLELYALTAGILLWAKHLKNKRIVINCDNQVVVMMVNNSTSGCKKSMILIRLITLECMVQNMRIYARYVKSEDNEIADALSRLEWRRFYKLMEQMNMADRSEKIPEQLFPPSKIWMS